MKPARKPTALLATPWLLPDSVAVVATPPHTAAQPSCPPRALPTVLFVHQSGDLYGSDRMLLSTAQALQRAGGHAIVLLPRAGALLQALQGVGIECHVLSDAAVIKLTRANLSWRGLCNLLSALPRAWRLWGRCLAGRPVDLVVSNTLAVLGGVPLAWRCKAPHLWHVHEIVEHPRWAARVFPWLAQHFAHRVVCNSRATLRSLVQFQPALAARSRVVWNGTPDPRLGSPGAAGDPADAGACRSALRQQFRPLGVPLAVGLVGRINRMKGQGLLLAAAAVLQQRGINSFSVVFVGDTPADQQHHLQQLRQQVAASGLSGRVVFTGFMAHTSAAYAALDIVCMPSTEAESFGLVAIEAMAAGLPVVAAAIGGLPELVVHDSTGALHKAGDAHALADALAPLLLSQPLRQRMGQAGRLRWQQLFAIETMDRHMVAELKQAANLRQPAAPRSSGAGHAP